jgi:hypothetical protein
VDALASQPGLRESYPDSAAAIIPYLRMAYSNTGGEITSTGYILGIFLVKAHYTVRGRRSIPLSISTEIRMMSKEKLDELRKALFEADQLCLMQRVRGP